MWAWHSSHMTICSHAPPLTGCGAVLVAAFVLLPFTMIVTSEHYIEYMIVTSEHYIE